MQIPYESVYIYIYREVPVGRSACAAGKFSGALHGEQ